MKIPVYLVCSTLRVSAGVDYCFRERRLTRQSKADKVLAIIEAPAGTRVRSRQDDHGSEQLLVPLHASLWARLLGRREVIPAKYVIGCARHRRHGLSLVSWSEPVAQDETEARTEAPQSV
jgi:hypothetical protein